MTRAVGLMLVLAVAAAFVLAAGSSSARRTLPTIGVVLPDPDSGGLISAPVERGGRAAGRALGDRLVLIPANGPESMREYAGK